MSDTRRRIERHVHADAGIHFNELVRTSAFATGQIQYHLRKLIDDDKLVCEGHYGRTHYYPRTYDAQERAVLALFRRETSREIVFYLIEDEPADPETVADALDIARSTLEYHLERLVEREVVSKRYGERNCVELCLENHEQTGRLLATVQPTAPDRLVDRFTRLIDDLLERNPEP
ncbi:ArsR family transcriptional regulator [Natrinema pellirubrum DSM 15624]|uniref:ArsR family transcriptional regulator n=1 Tax=Natrinema pellirubrum (strain DSM 15624 / CIP 106293 / JCM 10476 / NCIMB 786 / 157) TaxID=797303 RepID=L0JJY3_NATP1|nr:winged helix-turn-helix transcriptional regulator [Natrinema pellirubrum]AGB31825.1 hypothetical protein Natpe_1988 [Natrinema pellirubrum DSM 15624]ELY77390.1 ArsR family transcriptional regulator [Natrinema pellirubrum DSM 15624]